MIKRIAFVCRNPSLSVDEFHARWRGPHADLFAKNPAVQDHVLRYEQNHRKPRDYHRTDTPYDGAIIQWFDSLDAVHTMRTDSRWEEVRADAATLLDVDKTLEIFTENERVVIAGPDVREEPLTKLVCGVRRKPGMDREAFHKYWWEVHGPLNRETPAVRKYFIRYEQNHRLEADYARTEVDLEGVTCEWFPSTRAFFAMATDPESRDVIRADEENFLDTDNLTWILTEAEEVIFDHR
ncbi:MAG: EthD domain-containing protein [Acidimicrobiia bacterium]